MMRPLLLLVASLGIAAAFFKPAVPHQVPAEPVPVLERKTSAGAFADAGLDNPNVEEDRNIEAARKCGFCIGDMQKQAICLLSDTIDSKLISPAAEAYKDETSTIMSTPEKRYTEINLDGIQPRSSPGSAAISSLAKMAVGSPSGTVLPMKLDDGVNEATEAASIIGSFTDMNDLTFTASSLTNSFEEAMVIE